MSRWLVECWCVDVAQRLQCTLDIRLDALAGRGRKGRRIVGIDYFTLDFDDCRLYGEAMGLFRSALSSAGR